MPSSTAVVMKSGEQPRTFSWGTQAVPASSTTANQASLPLYKEAVYGVFQAIVAGTGAVTATVTFQVSMDDNTGRGYVFASNNAPGALVSTANTSTTLTANGVTFTQAMVGMTISAPGVPVGTTVSSIAAGGATLVMSAAATATANVQANFFANNWCATALGTITLSGTTSATDGFTTSAPWRYVRAVASNVTGTGATVTVLMGV